MNKLLSNPYNFLSIFLLLIILFFFSYNIKNFKLDASSDTLILQNDEGYKYFNYYNDIFPSNNFLVLAIKSEKQINKDFIKEINFIKNKLENIEGIDSTFSIVDAPILISNNLELSQLNKNIETINNSDLELFDILNEFSQSPIFKDQIINKNLSITSVIINIKKDNIFSDLKKQKQKFNESNKIDKQEFKNFKKKYDIAKKEYNQKRKILINQIRETLQNENIAYEYFFGTHIF